MPAVELSGVTKRYGVRQALCDVNLSLEQGSALGLLGRTVPENALKRV